MEKCLQSEHMNNRLNVWKSLCGEEQLHMLVYVCHFCNNTIFFKIISVNKLMKLWCCLTDSVWFFIVSVSTQWFPVCIQWKLLGPVMSGVQSELKIIVIMSHRPQPHSITSVLKHHSISWQQPFKILSIFQNQEEKVSQSFPFSPLSHSAVREETTDQDCFILSNPKSEIFISESK